MREQERENDLARRREIARQEANEINLATIKQHEREKKHAMAIKARYAR